MENKDTVALLSLYRGLDAKEAYRDDPGKQLDLATSLMWLIKKKILVADAVNAALFAGAQCVKIVLAEGDNGNTVDIALKFEELANSSGNSGWVNYYELDMVPEGVVDDTTLAAIEERLAGLSSVWENDVEGIDSVLGVPFEILEGNPGETMTRAKESIFSSDQRRVLESIERGDIVASRKKPRRRQESTTPRP